MNIVIITSMFPPARTGTSFYTANLSRELSGNGNAVSVITLDYAGSGLDDSAEIKKYNTYTIPTLSFSVKGWFKHFRICSILPSNYYKVHKIVKAANPDVILLVNHYLDIAFPAIFASIVNTVPLICSVGTQLQSCNPFRNKVLNFFDRLICGHFIFPFCYKIIAWDKEILRYLNDLHGSKVTDKCEVVNWGVNGAPEEFISHEHDYSLHNQILGVGAVSEQRNFLSLVEAFGIVASKYPDLKLKVIGHIYYDAAVRLAQRLGLSNRVIFTGELPHSEVLYEIKRSDAYFVSLTAKYVGLGTASIETMMMGVPVIANIPGDLLGSHILKDMEDVILCHGLSSSQVADKLCMLFDSASLRTSIGQNGRRFVKKFMSWDKVSADMCSVFNSCIGVSND
ncbi:MAG: glycosyltransferase family 4 protein [Desulfobacula sp.]|nr:glycosyltransferase family 4 protein [Desulfobacula sp.]